MRLSILLALWWMAGVLAGCSGAAMLELQTAKQTGKPIFVGSMGAGKPDSAGNVAARAQFFNTSHKTYKYVDLIVEAHNRVGDRVQREGDATPELKLRFTGPLAPRRTPGMTTWPRVWYMEPITCVDIVRIELTFMDASTLTLDGAALIDVLSEPLRVPCKRPQLRN